MSSQLLQDELENALLQEVVDAPVPVQEFLRHLAEQITNGPAPSDASDPAGQTPEVILEIDVAGARYQILRFWRPPLATPVPLSRREAEIAGLIAQGYANKTIAAELAISQWTVCTYIRRLFAKTGAVSRAAMVARLLEQGAIKHHPSPVPGLPLSVGTPNLPTIR